jgi:dolichol-phosphate mannosyltransferase
MDLSAGRARGYVFQVAILHRALAAGATVAEVPIHFADRASGESKLGLSDVLEFVWQAAMLRVGSSFLRFCVVGGLGVLVNLGVFSILLAAGLSKFLASPIAIEISIIHNFFLNNAWTFRGRAPQRRTRLKGAMFNLVSLAALGVNYSVFVLLSVVLPAAPPVLLQGVSIVPGVLVNYMLNSRWTFGGA